MVYPGRAGSRWVMCAPRSAPGTNGGGANRRIEPLVSNTISHTEVMTWDKTHRARHLSDWRAVWPGIGSRGNGTSAMVRGGPGCTRFIGTVAAVITRWSWSAPRACARWSRPRLTRWCRGGCVATTARSGGRPDGFVTRQQPCGPASACLSQPRCQLGSGQRRKLLRGRGTGRIGHTRQ
jgi:hypothetical protein